VLITHNHQDHFVLETLLRLRPRIECLVVPKSSGHLFGDISLKLLGQQLNFKQVVELDAMESLRLTPDVEIIAVPFLGEHGDLAHSKTAYVVRASNERIMFAADSNCLDRRMYEHVRRALGPVHTVFIGTESVGAPLTWNNGHLFLRTPTREQDQSRRYRGCDAAAALELLDALGAKRVYNYAMGREPWLEHLLGLGLSDDSPQLREGQELVQRARGRGFLAAESLFGQAEIFLDERQAPDSTGKSTAAANAPFAAQTSDTEDQFVF
jgi:L-ascorbate metabolism protein UlaG (beta-lactamase superfamily)